MSDYKVVHDDVVLDRRTSSDIYALILRAGDAITIFTPDDTHFDIAMYAINKGIHVLVTKPAVKTLEHHQELVRAAKEKG